MMKHSGEKPHPCLK